MGDRSGVFFLERRDVKKNAFTHDNADNKTVDWYTPPHIFEAMRLDFDLDPCAPVGGVPWIPAKNHYSINEDGLLQSWFGRVWLNPPYGRETSKWLEKMNNHRNGVALVFARTDCSWFHKYCANADAINFIKGRLSFVDAFGVTGGGGAGAGSMLIAWGDENASAINRVQGLCVDLTAGAML